MATLAWITCAAVAAGLIGAYLSELLSLDPASTIIGAVIGGGAGGWIAKRQRDDRHAGRNNP